MQARSFCKTDSCIWNYDKNSIAKFAPTAFFFSCFSPDIVLNESTPLFLSHGGGVMDGDWLFHCLDLMQLISLHWAHFSGAGQVSQEKLEFKHRLTIALGAAKGDLLQNQ